MAKKFSQFIKEAKIIYPVINARSPADQEFSDAHPTQVVADPAGNGDAVYNGSTQKDTTRRADKWTGDDDADDAAAETGLDTAGKYHTKQDIDEAFGHIKKGAFHKWLGKSEDEPITAADIKKGLAAGGHAAKMAEFAKASKHFVHEDFKELQEISKKVLSSYIKKAGVSAASHGWHAGHAGASDKDGAIERYQKASRKMKNRTKGIERATDKLVKEELTEEQLDARCIAEELVNEDYKSVLSKHGFSRSGSSYAKSSGGRVRVGEHGDWHHTSAHGERKTGKDHTSLDKHLGSVSEEVDSLQELSKSLLGRYMKKASKSAAAHHDLANQAHERGDKKATAHHDNKSVKRDEGILRAHDKYMKKD
jgi:hypothetical protein